MHRRSLVAALGLLCGTVTAQAQRARVSGSIETGAAAIEQPLVRSGAAFYIAPAAQLRVRDFTVGGDAVFATGTPIWQSFLGNGFLRTPAVGNVRLIGSGQVLKTSGITHTLHVDVGAEWRGGSAATTGAFRARSGQMRFGGNWYRDNDLGASLTHAHGAMLLSIDGSFSTARRPTSLRDQLGVTASTEGTFTGRALDLTPRMIWERGRLRADASVALRAVQLGASGTRVGPQLAFTLQAARGVSLFVGGVQRLPDVRSGIPAGRTALLGARVEGRRLLQGLKAPAPTGPVLNLSGTQLLIDVGTESAERVSLRGDFTEWKERSCARRGPRRFDCGAAPPAGTWRVAIRLDDGRWRQPGNLAPAADDFGSVEGVLMTGGKP